MGDGADRYGSLGREVLLPHLHPQTIGAHVHGSDRQSHSRGKEVGINKAHYSICLLLWFNLLCY